MYPYYPPMNYGYPHFYPPYYPNGHAATSPGTSLSELKPLSELESDDDASGNESRLKYKMGPILESVMSDFHRGEKILKDDTKKSRSSLLNLTSKSKKAK